MKSNFVLAFLGSTKNNIGGSASRKTTDLISIKRIVFRVQRIFHYEIRNPFGGHIVTFRVIITLQIGFYYEGKLRSRPWRGEVKMLILEIKKLIINIDNSIELILNVSLVGYRQNQNES
ncbi:uncharacterized protein LOC119653766 [Hermetia illucens]|uniref:uncharacterized protein LOC119653766 n=1 Tax=Hermetia illucens TaxID=343691 RepID=UPI0018CBF975|nr:uncharacterized protein LOC119653766 [Hermetia illucens]XP_037914685.1 uncharacterized protein LOC119653766 [Hermetia illucens]